MNLKPNARVIHIACRGKMNLKGKDLPLSIFDGVTGLPHLTMQLHPAGVLCKSREAVFIVPYGAIGTLSLDPADLVESTAEPKKAKGV
jgi:hypothetical protein